MSVGNAQGRPSVPLQEQAPGPIADDQLVAAFEAIRDELTSTLAFFLRNREDAMDIAQEAFLKCWKNREECGRVVNLKAWIYRVALNAARDLKRSAWRRKSRSMPEQEPPMTAPGGADLALQEEERRRVRDAVVLLRTEEREVFLLRQNGELTYEEIAETTGRPVGTVKTQMRTALQKLKDWLGAPDSVGQATEERS